MNRPSYAAWGLLPEIVSPATNSQLPSTHRDQFQVLVPPR